jgi:hypothetical protein
MLLVQCAVCEEIMGEMGITIDDNDTEKMKNIYCNKLEYENMISCTKLEDDLY